MKNCQYSTTLRENQTKAKCGRDLKNIKNYILFVWIEI